MRAIDNAASLETRGFFRLITNTGFEPVDAAALQVSDFYFDEEPARIDTTRKKTGKKLTGFLSDNTAQVIKQIIANGKKQDNDYVFTDNYSPFTVKVLSNKFKYAVCKAGFGKFVKAKSGSLCAVPNKIDGHTYSKYHLKVFKKRWFTMVVAAGVPEYVAQGMLGRKKYLDEYMRLPLDKKREFAKRILKIVEIYPSEADEQEKRKQISDVLGLSDLTPEQMQILRQNLFRMLEPTTNANKLLGG